MEQHVQHYSDIDMSSEEELEDDAWMDTLEKDENDYESFYKEKVDIIKIIYTYVDGNNNIYYVKKYILILL